MTTSLSNVSLNFHGFTMTLHLNLCRALEAPHLQTATAVGTMLGKVPQDPSPINRPEVSGEPEAVPPTVALGAGSH